MRRTITSLQHPLVKHLVKLRTDSGYRYRNQSLLLEGSKPIKEVSGKIKTCIYAGNYIPSESSNADEWIVTEAILKKISGLSNPEGVIAEIEMPTFGIPDGSRHLLVLDGINDPGNMGTLMRTALAFGWDGVFILPTSCDPFNEKVLRAARGAHFKLPLQRGSIQELQEMLYRGQFQPILADIDGLPPEKLETSDKMVLVMGNEAHGASQAVRKLCSSVAIPMDGQMESLNVAVAGGILLYLLKGKQER